MSFSTNPTGGASAWTRTTIDDRNVRVTLSCPYLRGVMGELKVADVRAQVALSLGEDFTSFADFTPRDRQAKAAQAMLDDLIAWSNALRPLRGQAGA